MVLAALIGCASEPAPTAPPEVVPGHVFVESAFDPVGFYWIAREDSIRRDYTRDERVDVMMELRADGTADICTTFASPDAYELTGHRGRFIADGSHVRLELQRVSGGLCGDSVEGPEIVLVCTLGRLDDIETVACPQIDGRSSRLTWSIGLEPRQIYLPRRLLTIWFEHEYTSRNDHTEPSEPRNWRFEWSSH